MSTEQQEVTKANGGEKASPPPVGEQSAAIAKIQADKALADLGGNPFSSVAAFRHYHQVAEIFAASNFVPAHFKEKPGDCLIALQMALQMQVHPLTLMQNVFMVQGRPGFQTQFMIACANRAKAFETRINWRVEHLEPTELEVKGAGWKMPNLRVTAYTVAKGGEEVAASVDSSMAIAEGWTRNEKYKTMLEHMLRWRSAAFLIRLYAPEVTMGLPTMEELETTPEVKNVTPAPVASSLDAFALAAAPSEPAEAANATETATKTAASEIVEPEEPSAPAKGKRAGRQADFLS